MVQVTIPQSFEALAETSWEEPATDDIMQVWDAIADAARIQVGDEVLLQVEIPAELVTFLADEAQFLLDQFAYTANEVSACKAVLEACAAVA